MTEQEIIKIRDEPTDWNGFIVQHEIGVEDLFVKTLFWINEQSRPVPLATAFGDAETIDEMTDLDLIPLPPSIDELRDQVRETEGVRLVRCSNCGNTLELGPTCDILVCICGTRTPYQPPEEPLHWITDGGPKT